MPIIADSKFMAAYSMIEPNSVYYQEDGKNELDVMFEVARMTTDEMWRTRLGRHAHDAWLYFVGQHWPIYVVYGTIWCCAVITL